MDEPFTPEHLQLMSDRKLQETVEERTTEKPPSPDHDALVRMARYEIRRRKGDVPVRDRYTST